MGVFLLILWSFATLGLFTLGYLLLLLIAAIAKHKPFRVKRVFGVCVWSCCGIFVFVGVFTFAIFLWNEWHHHDYISIDCRYFDISSALSNNDYPKAYSYMSPNYRNTHSLEQFKKEWGPGSLPKLWPGREISVWGGRAWLYPYDVGQFGDLLNGPDFQFVKIKGEWYLTGEIQWYLD